MPGQAAPGQRRQASAVLPPDRADSRQEYGVKTGDAHPHDKIPAIVLTVPLPRRS